MLSAVQRGRIGGDDLKGGTGWTNRISGAVQGQVSSWCRAAADHGNDIARGTDPRSLRTQALGRQGDGFADNSALSGIVAAL